MNDILLDMITALKRGVTNSYSKAMTNTFFLSQRPAFTLDKKGTDCVQYKHESILLRFFTIRQIQREERKKWAEMHSVWRVRYAASEIPFSYQLMVLLLFLVILCCCFFTFSDDGMLLLEFYCGVLWHWHIHSHGRTQTNNDSPPKCGRMQLNLHIHLACSIGQTTLK